jgi:hypothetical protein
MRCATVLACALLTLGCQKTIPLDGQLALGPSIQVADLEVWPVLANQTTEVEPVLTLEQAQKRDCVVIRELENAQVGSLAIENRGDTRILACAGTVVTGGKQDRQLGEDIVVDPQTTVSVKTFCVEQSRWSGGDRFEGTSLKASARVRTAGQYSNDQQQVWYDVEIAQAAGIGESGSYASVKQTSHRRQATAAKIEEHLRSQRGNVVGYAYAIEGNAAGIRTFAHPALLEPRLQGFVHAMCVEAELRTSGLTDFTPPRFLRDVGVDFRPLQEVNLVPSAYVPPDGGADMRLLRAHLRMASDAYDRADYARAEAYAHVVLARDPNNETAEELARIAQASRYVADDAQGRERFNAEWRALMAELQSTALPQPTVTTRPRKPVDIPTLFRKLNATSEKIVGTNGANRNGYRRDEEGNHSACYVMTKDGRWVPLTRDWTAK